MVREKNITSKAANAETKTFFHILWENISKIG